MAISKILSDSIDPDVSLGDGFFKVDSTNSRVGIGTSSPATTLDVAGTITSSGNVGIGTSSPQKSLVVSDGGAMGIELSPDDAGQGYSRILNFDRTTMQYEPLYIEGEDLRFSTGTSAVERMRIDNAGRVTMPYQPAFHVHAGSYTLATNAEVDAVSGSRTIHLNNGNHFSNTTLLFTAPIDGLYLMYVDVTRNSIGTSSGFVKLYKNATLISQALNYTPTTFGSAIAMATIQLSANDTVRGTFRDANSNGTDIYNAYFGGYLIG